MTGSYRKELLGYCDPWSARPGQSIAFKISSELGAPYRVELVRVICGDDSPGGPGLQVERIEHFLNGTHVGRKQALLCGSYVLVADAVSLRVPQGFRLEAWIWPTLPALGRDQTVAGRYRADLRQGYRIGLDAAGHPFLDLGATRLRGAGPLAAQTWWHLVASWHDGVATLSATAIVGGFPERIAAETAVTEVEPAPEGTAFLIAAAQGSDHALDHFNGKIESPRLSDGEGRVLAAWDFAADIAGETVVDRGPHALAGRTLRTPTRALPGHLWDGSEHDWKRAPAQYAAIHFHDDDLDDAGWDTDIDLTIPETLASGIYALRLSSEEDETFLPFFVRPPAGRPGNPVAFLASTATFMAYGNLRIAFESPIYEVSEGTGTPILGRIEATLAERCDLGPSHYDRHSDGSACMIVSRRRPILNFTLRNGLWAFNADTHVTAWLAAIGQGYDIVTDEDLHHEGLAALHDYRCVITGAHPEYWSTAMWDALTAYQAAGGRFMYLGGNGFYWRVAYHPAKPWLLECRRAESGARYADVPPGCYYHAFTGEYGGLWRRIGRTPQSLVGVGMVGDGWDRSEAYRRRPDSLDSRAAFIFDGIRPDEPIGNFGQFNDGAAGAELDVADYDLGTPRHALIVASSDTHSAAYYIAPEETLFLHDGNTGDVNRRVRADLVFYETPNGGAVFSTGSIAWCAALAHQGYDNNVCRLTGNVLRRFLDPLPFERPVR